MPKFGPFRRHQVGHRIKTVVGTPTAAAPPHTVDTGIYVLIFLLGILRASSTALANPLTFGAGFEPLAIARSLAHAGTFANPYAALATGPTAHAGPVYPFMLATILQLFGDGPRAALVSGVVECICFAILLCLLPALSRQIFGNESAGLVAALLSVIIPTIQVPTYGDAIPCSVVLAAVCLISLQRRYLLVAGALAGVGLLITPAVFLFFAPWAFGLVAAGRCRFRDGLVAVVLGVFVCVPWMVRNFITLGVFGIRDDFGLELAINNNDLAQPSFRANRLARLRSPNLSFTDAQSVKDLGEREYNARELTHAKAWIRAHPKRFASLTIRRFVLFWLPSEDESPFCYSVWLITALSLPGAWVGVQRSRSLVVGLIAGTFVFSALYAFVNAELRYRIPVLWVTLLFAGLAVTAVWRYARTGYYDRR